MLREDVRGGFPDPSFRALTGIDRARAFLRGTVPRPPLSHLVGYRVTQVGSGSATLAMPASPWLQAIDGSVAIQMLVDAALSMAALTGAPPGTDVRMTSMAFNHFRPATTDSDTLLARSRILNSGHTYSFTEVLVEDALGRGVGHATGAAVFRPGAQWEHPSSVTSRRSPEEVIDPPAYRTPDPPLRPLPPGVDVVAPHVWQEYDGVDIARMYLAGEVPTMPVAALLGLRVLDWDAGRIHVAIRATPWLCDSDGQISPGILALLAHAGLGGTSVQPVEPRGQRVGIVGDSVSFYRSVPPDGRDVFARGTVAHRVGDFLASSVEVTDADGNIVAGGHRLSVFMAPRPGPAARSQRRLLTVLFTDLVTSTERAEELGDERWCQLLAEHHRLVRRQLDIHQGWEVKTTGDGFLATFDSPTRAVHCARAVRDGVRRLGLEIRAGIHTGECEVIGGDVAGLAVHVASRVQSLARPGEILVSHTVRDLVTGSGVPVVARGAHHLKGLDGEWLLYGVEV